MKKPIRVIDYDVDDNGNLGVYAISIVERPAIGVDFVALNEQAQAKKDETKHMLYGPLLIPNQLILRIDEETNEEYYVRYSAATIEKVAHNYLINNNQHNATYEHERPVKDVTLVETWLLQGEHDKSKNFNFNLPEGTWFGGLKVNNPDVWHSVEMGDVLGFSIEGKFAAIREQYLRAVIPPLIKELEDLLKSAI